MGANAQTAVPAFVAGEVLTAAEMTQVNTGIPVFASTTTRDAAFSGAGEKTLAEGQFAYIEASDTTQYYNGSAWVGLSSKVVQVVSTTKTNTFSTSSSTFTDVTGLSVTITPTSSSSQVLVLATFSGSCDPGVTSIFARLLRGATAIDIGDAAGSRIQASNDIASISVQKQTSGNIVFLDSPATTSATTYKMQVASPGASNITIGGSSDNTDSVGRSRTPSTILVMEIAA